MLLVSGNTLYFRFFGFYVVEKKLNNFNYVVVILDRRKQTQLCYINMLKPYLERDNNVVKELVNVNVVIFEPEDLSSEFSNSYLSPTDTSKLTNFDVLKNLDSKLSHFEESQRQDL